MRCPLCFRETDSTSGICPFHIVITYDSNGRVINFTDVIERRYNDRGGTTGLQNCTLRANLNHPMPWRQ